MVEETIILGVKIRYSKNCVTVMDSYRIKSRREMEKILRIFKIQTGYKSKRSLSSWVREWVAHNRLYKMNIARSRTKDCDMEEEIERWRESVYYILSL